MAGSMALPKRPAKLESPDLVGHFPLDESERGPPVVERDGRQGKLLDGENNVTFPGVGAFTRSDPFTISLWIRAPKHLDRAVVFHRSRAWTDAGSQGYQLLIEEGRLSAALIHFWPGDAIRIRTGESLPIGRWVPVAVTYDGSARAAGLRIWIDGVEAESSVVRDSLTRKITGGGSLVLTLGQRFRDLHCIQCRSFQQIV